MACYGGECTPACPLYVMHHPKLHVCPACGAKSLSWYVEDGLCPHCGNPLGDGSEIMPSVPVPSLSELQLEHRPATRPAP